jgi:hypothetical protein
MKAANKAETCSVRITGRGVLSFKHNNVKEDDVGRACSTNGGEEECIYV